MLLKINSIFLYWLFIEIPFCYFMFSYIYASMFLFLFKFHEALSIHRNVTSLKAPTLRFVIIVKYSQMNYSIWALLQLCQVTEDTSLCGVLRQSAFPIQTRFWPDFGCVMHISWNYFLSSWGGLKTMVRKDLYQGKCY